MKLIPERWRHHPVVLPSKDRPRHWNWPDAAHKVHIRLQKALLRWPGCFPLP